MAGRSVTLSNDTLLIIQRQKSTSGELSSFLGRWTGTMVLRRPTLSVFYVFYEKKRKTLKISREIAAELESAMQLAPLLKRNWYRPCYAISIVYDAYLSSGAVVDASASESWYNAL